MSMKVFISCLLAGICLPVCGLGQDEEKLANRFGFAVNLNAYPQKTPQETLLSLAMAINNKRVDYLLAQLADPQFVDERVSEYQKALRRGAEEDKRFLAFDRLVDETTKYFLGDPTSLKELRRFGKEAEWQVTDKEASGSLKGVQGRKVFLKKLEGRWFLENKQQ